MQDKFRNHWLRGFTASAALLAACGGGGGGGGSAGEGTLRMALTDAPSCGYDNVFVTVERVRVHQDGSAADGSGGWQDIVLATPRRVDLLELTNGVLEELGQTRLPAGRYNQIRLVLSENTGANPLANAVKPTGSGVVPLRTPSAQQSGLKLQSQFDVGTDQTADLVLDFDACRSVVQAGGSGNYNLKPVLSVAQRLSTGIQGYVSTTIATTLAGTTVSAQQNGAVIRSTVPETTGRFLLPYLPAGNYDIVVTSNGYSTAIVTGVPVTTAGITALNPSTSALLPPTATARNASGTTYVGTGTTLETEADVAASQALTGGPTVLIARTPVDATTATWQLPLSSGAPVKAPYASTGTLTFAPDAAVAGRYRFTASAPGRTAVTQEANLSTADQVVDLRFAP